MSIRTGTSHFKSREAAMRYYAPYGFTDVARAVDCKLADGEIHIGPPALKSDGSERFILIDGGLRYAIEDSR